jgi:hypothetical protein
MAGPEKEKGGPLAKKTGTDIDRYVLSHARANKGDAKALAEVRATFDADPALAHRVGNVATIAMNSIVKAATGGAADAEAARRHISNLREQVAGEGATVLEQALAERVALSLYESRWLDAAVAFNATTLNAKALDLLDKRRHRAFQRAMKAAKTFATVRRLLRGGPEVAVQVNVRNEASRPE